MSTRQPPAAADSAPRHSGTAPRTRRRRGRLLLPAGVALALVAVGAVALVGGSAPAEACPSGERAVRVVAAPEIAAVLADLLEPSDAADACRHTEVEAADPAQVASGLREDASDVATPDVWVPDSSLWLAAAGVTGDHPSIATSPVVLGAAGAPEEPADATALLTSAGSGTTAAARLVLPDPRSSAASTAVVAGLHATAVERAGLRSGVARALRQAVPSQVADATTLLRTLTPDHLVAVSEQAVWAHNVASEPAHRVTAVYPADGGAVLDYPFVVLPGPAARSGEAERLLEVVRSPRAVVALAGRGFRTATGTFPDQAVAPPGVDAEGAVAVDVLTSGSRQAAEDALAQLALGSRMLAAIDVSGSMAARVDGGPRRLDLVKAAAASALTVLPPDSSIGVWVFATGMPEGGDHRELVPVGPLDEVTGGTPRASLVAGALESTSAVDGGGTPLYDTALAAVRAMRRDWDPRRVNSVVLLTDGHNQDSDSISLDELLTTLAEEADPLRPVPVITIAYGPEADAEALQQISDVTDGAAYTAPAPHQIEDVFLDAVGQRVCRPSC